MQDNNRDITPPAVDLGFAGMARHLATLMALLGGCLAIAQLWWAPLSEASLWHAGRGIVLILLAIGLMGTARLSLVLTLLVALSGLDFSPSGNNPYTAWIEPVLIGATGLALVARPPKQSNRRD